MKCSIHHAEISFEVMCYIAYTFYVSNIQDVSVSVSVMTLTFIAYDRYHAICNPLHFSARKTKAAVVIGVIWTISGILALPDWWLVSKSFFDLAYFPCLSDDLFFDLSACGSIWGQEYDFALTLTKVT